MTATPCAHCGGPVPEHLLAAGATLCLACAREAWDELFRRLEESVRLATPPEPLPEFTVKHAVAGVLQVEDAARAGDDEGAHAAEDRAAWALLWAIAQGRCADPKACAAVTILSRGMRFTRRCG